MKNSTISLKVDGPMITKNEDIITVPPVKLYKMFKKGRYWKKKKEEKKQRRMKLKRKRALQLIQQCADFTREESVRMTLYDYLTDDFIAMKKAGKWKRRSQKHKNPSYIVGKHLQNLFDGKILKFSDLQQIYNLLRGWNSIVDSNNNLNHSKAESDSSESDDDESSESDAFDLDDHVCVTITIDSTSFRLGIFVIN